LSIVPRPRRVLGVALAAVAAVPLLAACATSPGAAATVGSHRISVTGLQSQVRTALANPKAASQFGKDRAGFTRQVLAQSIGEQIIAAAAQAHHVTATPKDIAAQLAAFTQQAGGAAQLKLQAAQGGVPPAALNQIVRSDALQNKLGDALVADVPVNPSQLQAAYTKNIAQFEQAHVAHILVKRKSLGEQLLTQVRRDPSRFAALAKRYSTDTGSAAKGGDLGSVGKGSTVAPFDRAIFADKVGSYVLVHSQYGYHVIHIISRTVESLSQATPALKDQILSSQRNTLLTKAFVAESKKLGVHVSPRYGTWDPTKQVVNPSKATVSVGK
jgi:parvulin-like peptidyl-prolyl isomerase